MRAGSVHLHFEGGRASQLLALAAGIYFKNQHNVKFILNYHQVPSTHTNSFKLTQFLLYDETYLTTPPINKQDIKMGKFWSRIPVRLRPYTKWLRLLYQNLRLLNSKIKPSFKRKDQKIIEGKTSAGRKVLSNLNPSTEEIYGPFWPGLISEVWEELDSRFKLAKINSPFDKISNFQERIVVHYRLGDMRSSPYWANSHGVIAPNFFLDLADLINKNYATKLPVHVYSDEPDIVNILMNSVGLTHWNIQKQSSLWNDINEMKNCLAFIGSFSTVSSLVCEIRKTMGLKNNYLPLNSRQIKTRKIEKLHKVNYVRAGYLSHEHWIYKI